MIVKLNGKMISRGEHSVVVDVQGLCYEVVVPVSVLQRLDEKVKPDGTIELIIYHYIQIGPSSGSPVLIGFLNEVERDFFMLFIKVSGIGPRAAAKAINKPISAISRAIADGDFGFLKTLPGIGAQKAKEIIAKLQNKVGKYGLIQDSSSEAMRSRITREMTDWQEEALEILLQLQYKRQEAQEMISKALKRSEQINTAEDLLNEIYKQRISR